MKFGSVKFFKVLILFIIALLIIVPIIISIILGLKYNEQKKVNEELRLVNNFIVQDYVGSINNEYDVQNKSEDNKDGAGRDNDNVIPKMPQIESSFDYQELYPHLYVDIEKRPKEWEENDKVCYLTFDDGPSDNTGKILQILEKNDVKATFFVTGESCQKNEEILRKAALEGHTIAVHTWSHDYNEIYASVEDFLNDFNLIYLKILEITGVAPTIFRFPGGSINNYNQNVYLDIVAEMSRRGFVFYDWNVAASDAVVGGISKNQVYQNVINGASSIEDGHIIVLMHDRLDTGTTVDALTDIIKDLRSKGYTFEALGNEVKPVTYYYNTN